MSSTILDYCVIGGGIVGLATAMELLRCRPQAQLALLEKEPALAQHQTGHNSGVIHSGIYYAPGSLKARLCKEGEAEIKRFCAEYGIPFETCGKLLVATSDLELTRMKALAARARENGIHIEELSADELSRREPNIVGRGAIFVPATGIVDYKLVATKMGEIIQSAGGNLALGSPVTLIREESDSVLVETSSRTWRAQRLVVCAGLQSDRLVRLSGLQIGSQIVPFRGEYYRLTNNHNHVVKHLIYPIPNPELPFLGIHLTRMIDGSVTVGPNAVLGFSREKYAKFSLNLRDVLTYAQFPGFWRVMRANWKSGLHEFRNSLSKSYYLKECQRYCPKLRSADLLPASAGIRAQAVLKNGTLVHDFLFERTKRMLHVLNAPSPAATASIPIGRMIVDELGV